MRVPIEGHARVHPEVTTYTKSPQPETDPPFGSLKAILGNLIFGRFRNSSAETQSKQHVTIFLYTATRSVIDCKLKKIIVLQTEIGGPIEFENQVNYRRF